MKTDVNKGFKIFTHDFRPPIQGGAPVFYGRTPFTLPAVPLDASGEECGAGWNYVADLAAGFRIAGLWPTGRPSTCFVVEAENGIERGNKRRASVLHIVRACTTQEVEHAIEQLSATFKPWRAEISREQILWRAALARPEHSVVQAETELERALRRRGLSDWKLKKFDSAWDARAAWDAWDAWAARAARDAWAALTVWFAAKQKWTSHDSTLLTAGLRDAYRNGLECALPIGPNTLGYVMAKSRDRQENN